MVTDRVELAEIVDRLTTAGIDQLFVPGGDAAPHDRLDRLNGAVDGGVNLCALLRRRHA